jgi:hypothetical protein
LAVSWTLPLRTTSEKWDCIKVVSRSTLVVRQDIFNAAGLATHRDVAARGHLQ